MTPAARSACGSTSSSARSSRPVIRSAWRCSPGARDEQHLEGLRGLLARASVLETSPTDYEAAAALYRTCRRHGETVRKLIDCLIAAHAIREGVALLHADPDFDRLSRCTPLQVCSVN